MDQIIFIAYCAAFVVGVTSLTIALNIYKQFKKYQLKGFILFVTMLFFFQINALLNSYQNLNHENYELIFNISLFFKTIALFLNTTFGPKWINNIFGNELNIYEKLAFRITGSSMVLTLIVFWITRDNKIIFYIANPLSLAVVGYYAVILCIKIKNQKKRLKPLDNAVKYFVYSIVLYFPILSINYLSRMIFQTIVFETQPILFLFINIGLIHFSKYVKYARFIENDKLTEFFKLIYQITDRQEEIILMVKDSLSNKEISDNLYISTKTVENHLQSIYKKLRIGSREELVEKLNKNI